MLWTVSFHDDFDTEFETLPQSVQEAIVATSLLLKAYGPALGRPHADTLAGSRHANMKELRVRAGDGAWRIAFAFDPERRAVLLIAGDKSGVAQKLFYKRLIARADHRFDQHLATMEKR